MLLCYYSRIALARIAFCECDTYILVAVLLFCVAGTGS